MLIIQRFPPHLTDDLNSILILFGIGYLLLKHGEGVGIPTIMKFYCSNCYSIP